MEVRGCAEGGGEALEGPEENETTETIVRMMRKWTARLVVSNLLRLSRGFACRTGTSYTVPSTTKKLLVRRWLNGNEVSTTRVSGWVKGPPVFEKGRFNPSAYADGTDLFLPRASITDENRRANYLSRLATHEALTILRLNGTNGLRLDNEQSDSDSPQFSAEGFRFAIVASRWNDQIVSRLIDGAQEALKEARADEGAVKLFRVPGSFELSLCALKAAESKEFDAVICLGVIIRGETPHFDYVAAETARGINEVGLKTGVPVMFGVITANTVEQALARAGVKRDNKGYDAALAAVDVVNLYQESFSK